MMAYAFHYFTKMYNHFLNELDDPDTRSWFMVQSSLPIVSIIIAYILSVVWIGPNFMAKRPPYSLHRVIVVTNIVQIVVNAWLTKQFASVLWTDWGIVCRGTSGVVKSQHEILAASSAWHYFMLKLLDLSDTAIFILRKKYRQASFLHVYHHVGTLTMAWWVVKYFPGGAIIPIQLMNCIVHTIMFAYYTLAAMGPSMKPYLGWKRYLTMVQMVQFLLMIALTIYVWMFKCTFPILLLYVYLPYMIIMLFMFSAFFKRTYSEEDKIEEKTK